MGRDEEAKPTLRCSVTESEMLPSNFIFWKSLGEMSSKSSRFETCLSTEIELPILFSNYMKLIFLATSLTHPPTVPTAALGLSNYKIWPYFRSILLLDSGYF